MNKTASYQFTVIVPVYNEEDNVARLEQTFAEWLKNAPCLACVLFVNDGSTDNSLSLLQEVCSRRKDMFYISFRHNAGLSAAIKAGIDYTYSPLLGYIDADLQTSPEDFNLLLPYAKDYQLVTGVRANRKDTAFKRVQSKIANGFRRMVTGDGATDTGCPLKVMHTVVAKKIPLFKGMHRFFPALVLLQDGAKYKELPVRHFPRKAGVSKFNMRNRLIAPFVDCFAYRWIRARAINYKVSEHQI